MKFYKKLAGLAACSYAGMGLFYQYRVSHPTVSSYESLKKRWIKEGAYDEEFLDNIKREPVIIRSQHDYDLFGYYIDNQSENTVVISHGITSNIYGSLKYLKLYTDLGFNVVIYDHRNHGRSGGTETTYGYYERDDLELFVHWVKDKFPHGAVGTHGESMGGAIVLLHQAKYHSSDFLVVDCSYSRLEKVFREVNIQDGYEFVNIVTPFASIISKFFGTGSYKEIDPIDAVAQIERPIFFIHGEDDTYVYKEHSRDNFAAKQLGYKKIYFAKDSDHGMSIICDRENYKKEMIKYLDDIGIAGKV